MRPVVFDIETTGLDVDTVDVHCMVIREPGEPPMLVRPGEIRAGVEHLNTLLDQGYTIAGHNVVEFDIPILQRFGLRPRAGQVYDTLVASRAAYPGQLLRQLDFAFLAKHPELAEDLQPRHHGAHSLKQWGLRLGCPKDDYDGGWERFSEEMLAYNAQDVDTNIVLLEKLRDRIPDEAALVETQVAEILRRQRLVGVAFNVDAAQSLVVQLAARRAELTAELRKAFPAWYVPDGTQVPKRTQESRKVGPGEEGYRNVREGCAYTKTKLQEFNPGSADHIADRLTKLHGWKPGNYTDSGKVSVTEAVLADLRYPVAPLLVEYQQVQKILGFIAEGNNGWLKLERDGRIHGRVLPTGTVTTRMSHQNPNLGQVPSPKKPYGKECRQLFVASPGKVLVGADASGLQLRMLGHYLAPYDGGAFAQAVLDDPHTYMMKGTGIIHRDYQKTWTYAKLFGAQALKLGTIILDDRAAAGEKIPLSKARALGRASERALAQYMTGLDELERKLGAAAERGYLLSLDRRRVPVLSEHRALNTLLMSAEAVLMKHALVLAAPAVYARGGEFVLNVHDEWQVECEPGQAEGVGEVLTAAMRNAGLELGLRCQIDAEYHVGATWADTH